jgi:hypothetical protein
MNTAAPEAAVAALRLQHLRLVRTAVAAAATVAAAAAAVLE